MAATDKTSFAQAAAVPNLWPEFPKAPPSLLDNDGFFQWQQHINEWNDLIKWRLSGLQTDTNNSIRTISAAASSGVATLTARISTEETVRASADSALATSITTVTAAYQSADTTLQSNITIEATTRASADSTLATSITSLTSAYQAADATLQSNITTEATTRASADTTLATSITNLTSAYQAADTTLQANITTEATTRASADSALSTSISTVSATANSKAKISVQGTAPSSPSANDLWIDTSDNNKRKFWDGAAWQYKQDGILAAAVSTEASARATADGFLEGKYTLTVIAGNVVTGMNITSSTGGGSSISSVIFRATDFKIYNSSSGVEMFSVSGTDVKLGGTFTVDKANGKLYMGTGTYGDASTPWFVDSSGRMSLNDKLLWDGSSLTINGSGTFTGTLDIGTGLNRTRIESSGSPFTVGYGQAAFTRISGSADQHFVQLYASNDLQVELAALPATGFGGSFGRITIYYQDDTQQMILGQNAIEFFDGTHIVNISQSSTDFYCDSPFTCAGVITAASGLAISGSHTLEFTSGGGVTYAHEDWGWTYVGDSAHNFNINGSSLCVGFTSGGSSLGTGRVYLGASDVYLYNNSGALYAHDANGDYAVYQP